MLKRVFLALSAMLAAGCSDNPVPSEPLSDLPFAVATNSCGPADGPVVAIYLASTRIESLQPSAPFISIRIPHSFETVGAGSKYQITELFTDASAFFHGSGIERTANGGEVGITSKSSTTLTGYVDLRFADGPRMRGTFAATWQPTQFLCG